MAEELGGTFTPRGTTLTLHRIGFGAMRLTDPRKVGPPRDPDAALAVVREAVALGIDHIDTAEFYGPHVVNELIRRALAPYPERLTIVTKVGYERDEQGAFRLARGAGEIAAAVHENLRSLGLDAIDLVNLRLGGADGRGRVDDPIDAPLAALMDLVRQGLVRHVGVSNATANQVARARAMAPIACVQNEYNLAHRDDDALVDELADAGIAYVPYFPLGGFTPLQSGVLEAVAASLEATPLQVALAWLLHRSPNVLLIPGTSSVEHLRENVAAASLELPPDALAKLDGIAASASGSPRP